MSHQCYGTASTHWFDGCACQKEKYIRMEKALTNIREHTITDADGPELRAQNANNYRWATAALQAAPPIVHLE